MSDTKPPTRDEWRAMIKHARDNPPEWEAGEFKRDRTRVRGPFGMVSIAWVVAQLEQIERGEGRRGAVEALRCDLLRYSADAAPEGRSDIDEQLRLRGDPPLS